MLPRKGRAQWMKEEYSDNYRAKQTRDEECFFFLSLPPTPLKLCDHGQIVYLICFSDSLVIKWEYK